MLSLVALAALAAGFGVTRGVGATVRLLLRHTHEGRVRVQAGRLGLVDRR